MSFLDGLGLKRDQIPQGADAILPPPFPPASPKTHQFPKKPDVISPSPAASFIDSVKLATSLPLSFALPGLAVAGVVKWFAHQEKSGKEELRKLGQDVDGVKKLVEANKLDDAKKAIA